MAGLARVDMEAKEREAAPVEATARFDLAEQVRRRWVSIAVYYIAQRRNFEQGADLDDEVEGIRGFSTAEKI